jgi:CRP-like cAMP-binding protein/predicted MFS family arabinose efflux permease
MASVPGAKLGPFTVLRRRNFALLWTGQLVSTIGSALTSIAAAILVYRLTQSALSVGLMLMVTAAPSLVVGLVAGVYVDRADRKRILMAADLIRGALVFLIPVLIPSGIAWLYVIVLLSSSVSTFFDPAFESVLPELAPDEELASANALMSISQFGSTAIGFAAAGFIASTISIDWAFWIDAATFVFSASCVFLSHLPASPAAEAASSVASVATNLRAGVGFLARTPILRSLLLTSVLVFFSFGLWNSLLLPFALRALHATEFEYSIQEGVTSLGFVAGSLLMANWAGGLREGQWLSLSFLAMGAVGAFYASASSVPLAILLVTISGFANAPSSIGRRLIIQRHTPRELRGRVNSGFFVARDLVFLLGMAAAGLADLVDVRYLVMASSILLIAAGLLALVLPGLGQPAAEWLRSVALLRAAPSAGGMSLGRIPTPDDLDRLFGHLPVLAGLSERDKDALLNRSLIREAPTGTCIVRRGEMSTAAYFILSGQVLVGHPTDTGEYRSLATLTTGDYFGEIAALTGSPRTADVAATEPTTLIEVPSAVLRGFMGNEVVNRLILATMSERLTRTYSADLPRLAGLNPDDLLDLRTPHPEPSVVGGEAVAGSGA